MPASSAARCPSASEGHDDVLRSPAQGERARRADRRDLPLANDESPLQGRLKLGRWGVPVGRVDGGCGVCRVRIVEGTVRPLGPVSRANLSVDEERSGITPACRVAPVTAVVLALVGRLAKPSSQGLATPSGHVPTLPSAPQRGD
jgi:ferredoxin